jgi:hypothetical protein
MTRPARPAYSLAKGGWPGTGSLTSCSSIDTRCVSDLGGEASDEMFAVGLLPSAAASGADPVAAASQSLLAVSRSLPVQNEV